MWLSRTWRSPLLRFFPGNRVGLLSSMEIIHASAPTRMKKVEGFRVRCTSKTKIQAWWSTKDNSSTLKRMVSELSITARVKSPIKESSEQAKRTAGASRNSMRVSGKRMIMTDGASTLPTKYSTKGISFKADITEWESISKQKLIKPSKIYNSCAIRPEWTIF